MSFSGDSTSGMDMQSSSLLNKLLGSAGDTGVPAGPMTNNPTTKKPKQRSTTATFLGSDATPGPASGNLGGKTLLGA